MGYDDKIMLVHVLFEKVQSVPLSRYYHSQVSYVGSGVFDINIDGITQKLKEEILSMYHQSSGTLCIEAGELIDIFSPIRRILCNDYILCFEII